MKSGFYLRVVFAGLLLMNGAPAAAQAEPPAELAKEQAIPDISAGAVAKSPERPLDVTAWITLPGEFAMRTIKGYYITAINGGGRTTDPIVVTAARSAGPWEKFRLAMDPPPLHDKSIQTSGGNYLTAVDGGGRTADVLHTDATQVRDWEQFRLVDLSAGGAWFAIQTIRGNYLTAVGEGGKYEDAVHTDATQIGLWESIRVVKCGDLGSGYQYTIIPANERDLVAVNGGGLDQGETIEPGYVGPSARVWAKFKFIRQSDGSYALQTFNGVNFVTALGGGGQVQKSLPDPDWECRANLEPCVGSVSTIFHTDATQVQAWERFKFIDQGNCKYAIQTVSGFFVGIFQIRRMRG